ncbi:MAG TPA: peptide ABC transporter substrate-binding protein [Candidatus Cybelea sp.]|jgi:peptide/nickel transport system substrate-binding protein|nr:peptide ABC transporter substrate-binding protein [Candidatus Cybelea sp.]
MSRISRLLAVAVAVAALCSCTKGGQSSATPHYLTIADGTGDVTTLNPHLFTETTLGYISQMTQAYLVKYDAQNRPYPELLTVVPTQANGGISKDGDTITWRLRKGVRWSDGAPFSADDVVFSTKVVLNPANNEVGRDGWNLITKIDEPDKYTVVYHLKHPYSPYIPTFFGSAGANPTVLPVHLLAKFPNINNIPYNSKPVGIGPFRVVDWKRGDTIDLEANPYYFRGAAKLQRITYKLIPSRDTLLTLMQTGEVELWPEVAPSYIYQTKALPNVHTDVHPGIYYSHLDFNVTRPLVSDVRVRQAIRYAIDRRQMVAKISHGYATLQESFVSPVLPFAPKGIPFFEHDADKARALLEAAGWKMGPGGIRVKNGQRLSLQFPYYTGVSTADDTVEMIREELRAVGIDIQTRKFAPAMFFAPYQNGGIVYGSKWDMTMFAWQDIPIPDYSNTLECNQIPPNGQNVLHYCNARADALMEKIKTTYDPAEQAKLFDQEVRMVIADCPTIVLAILDTGFTYNPNLTGYNPGAFTPFDNMTNVDI